MVKFLGFELPTLRSNEYQYNSAQLYLLLESIDTLCKTLKEYETNIHSKAETLANSKNIVGNRWTQISEYLECYYGGTVYKCILDAIDLLYIGMQTYYGRFLIVDSDPEAIIDTLELHGMSWGLGEFSKKSLNNILLGVEKTILSIDDLISWNYKAPDQEVLVTKLQDYMERVADSVEEAENAANQTIAALKSLIDSIYGFIIDALTWKSIDRFDKKKFESGQAYKTLSESYKTASKQRQEWLKKAQILGVPKLIYNVKQEWKEREKTANTLRIITGVIGTVGGIVLVVTMPGAGAVVIAGVYGAASGTFNETMNQWADPGRAAKGDYNYGSILYSGTSEGLKGSFNAYTGSYFAKLSTGASFWGTAKYEVAKEVVNNVANKGIDTTASGVEYVIFGNKEHFVQNYNDVTNPVYWAETGSKSVLTGVGSASVGKLFDRIPTVKTDNKVVKITIGATKGGLKKVTEKVVEKGTDGAVEAAVKGENPFGGFVDGVKSTKPEDIYTWGVQGFVESAITKGYEQYGGKADAVETGRMKGAVKGQIKDIKFESVEDDVSYAPGYYCLAEIPVEKEYYSVEKPNETKYCPVEKPNETKYCSVEKPNETK